MHSGVASVGAISRLAHRTFPHPHTFIHLQAASPHLPYPTPPSPFFDLFLSSIFPPPPTSSAQERGQEPSGSLEQQVVIVIGAFLLLSGITGNKQADSLQRDSFPHRQGDIYVVEEGGQGSDPSVED